MRIRRGETETIETFWWKKATAKLSFFLMMRTKILLAFAMSIEITCSSSGFVELTLNRTSRSLNHTAELSPRVLTFGKTQINLFFHLHNRTFAMFL